MEFGVVSRGKKLPSLFAPILRFLFRAPLPSKISQKRLLLDGTVALLDLLSEIFKRFV
jgi:hypothetical protein